MIGVMGQMCPGHTIHYAEQGTWQVSSNGMVKDEIDILYAASNKLTQASTPLEQLESVSDYARENGAYSGTLFYIDNDADSEPKWAEIVANWALVDETIVTQLSIGERYYVPDLLLSQMLHLYIDVPYLIEDMESQPQLDVITRQNFERLGTRATAILPLNNKGRWVGLFMFSWHEPRRFTERDQRIYTAIVQQASAAIDSVRLFEQTQKRAAELETAKDEIEFLYAASNMLARASTSAELLEAVSAYPRDKGAVSGQLFHFRHDQLDRMDTVATWGIRPEFKLAEGYTLELGQRAFAQYWLSRPLSPTLIADVMGDELVDPVSRELFANLGTRALALLPLYTNGRWIGVFSFYWQTPHTFDERDQRIFTALQRQLAPVIDSMWLFEQNRERVLRAEHLLRVNTALSQATDEIQILSAVAQYALTYDVGRLFLEYVDVNADGKQVTSRIVAMWENGIAGLYDPNEHDVYNLEDDGLPPLWEKQPEEVIYIEDFSTSSYFTEELRNHILPRVKGRAIALFPLYSGGRYHGLISIVWFKPHNFSDEERHIYTELMQTVPSIVASRRAYLAEQARAHELETVAKVSAAATRILDVSVLLKTTVELTQLNFTDYHLAVYLLDPSGRYLEKAASASADVDIPHGFTFALDDEQSMIAQAGKLRQSIIVNDTTSSNQYTLTAFCKDTHSEMTIPMIVADKLIGVLDVQSSILNRFSETDARVMSMLADLIAVAVQNARLYEQAQELAALEERNRLARELHDSVSQALYGIALGARTAHALLQHDPARLSEPLEYVLSLAEAGLTEMRALIFDLRPESLENEGLIMALHKQAEVLQGRHGIQVITDFCTEPALSLEIKEMLYRIAREALHNTVKHAQASQVSLRLNETTSSLALEIIDNGHGFNTNGAFPGHLGLQSMRERAARLNADLEITSAPEKGTRISIQIPLLFN